MTTTSIPQEFLMDPFLMDADMELGTSPHPRTEDVDFELDHIQDTSVDNSMIDDTEQFHDDMERMQGDEEHAYRDDDMLDDGIDGAFEESEVQDLDMETTEQKNYTSHDAEILYEEEDARSHTMLDESLNPTDEFQVTALEAEEDGTNATKISEPGQELDFQTTETHDTNHDVINATNGEEQRDSDAQRSHVNTPPEPYFSSHSNIDTVDFGGIEALDEISQATEHDLRDPPIDSTHALDEVQQSTEALVKPSEMDVAPLAPSDPSETEVTLETESSETLAPTRDERETLLPSSSLHLVKVVYLEQEMSLFPPIEQENTGTFFLADSSLAHETFEKLLLACREILGDTLEHDDELVMDVPTLGLHICEDSKYAANITLLDVIDVYLNLSRNDKAENTDPLYCHLSSRVSLTSQLAYLRSAVDEGKPYSEIVADYMDSPDSVEGSYDESTEQLEQQGLESITEDQSTFRVENPGFVDETVDQGTYNPELDDDQTENENVDPPSETHVDASNSNEEGVEIQKEIVEVENLRDAGTTEEEFVEERPNATYDYDLAHSSEYDHVAETTAAEQGDNQGWTAPRSGINEQHLDAQTPSSHTVEADQPDSIHEETEGHPLSKEEYIEGSAEHTDSPQTKDDNPDADDIEYPDEDLFQHDGIQELVEASTAQDKFEAEEDLFAQDNEPTNHDINDVINDGLEFDELSGDSATEHVHAYPDKANHPLDIENDLEAAPTTPSKQPSAKRKVVDDDVELELFDIDTPEPKRTRAS